DGIYYYVMQFIPGQALDQVLREVRRLGPKGPVSPPPHGCALGHSSDLSMAASATDIARELLSGRFASIAESAPAPIDPSSEVSRSSVKTASRKELPDGVVRSLPESPNPPESGTASTVHTQSRADSSTLSGSSREYWRGVARIGEQVAEALQYAHGQG